MSRKRVAADDDGSNDNDDDYDEHVRHRSVQRWIPVASRAHRACVAWRTDEMMAQYSLLLCRDVYDLHAEYEVLRRQHHMRPGPFSNVWRRDGVHRILFYWTSARPHPWLFDPAEQCPVRYEVIGEDPMVTFTLRTIAWFDPNPVDIPTVRPPIRPALKQLQRRPRLPLVADKENADLGRQPPGEAAANEEESEGAGAGFGCGTPSDDRMEAALPADEPVDAGLLGTQASVLFLTGPERDDRLEDSQMTRDEEDHEHAVEASRAEDIASDNDSVRVAVDPSTQPLVICSDSTRETKDAEAVPEPVECTPMESMQDDEGERDAEGDHDARSVDISTLTFQAEYPPSQHAAGDDLPWSQRFPYVLHWGGTGLIQAKDLDVLIRMDMPDGYTGPADAKAMVAQQMERVCPSIVTAWFLENSFVELPFVSTSVEQYALVPLSDSRGVCLCLNRPAWSRLGTELMRHRVLSIGDEGISEAWDAVCTRHLSGRTRVYGTLGDFRDALAEFARQVSQASELRSSPLEVTNPCEATQATAATIDYLVSLQHT
ncbi:unnamed protein product (mitochondrion) [Plasmodiophora brassicae]|uniref:Uncharacterized protein n=1 Tax=Plasmodiophora brassicae TaxID=37360 RepID=A0A0G4IVB5_PLABS|nr:hypothetical protein PBRA_001053 [Plasmodiophora brassicae]SPQ97161.1 unnamed protein product [Plasmodiophora brassicae]